MNKTLICHSIVIKLQNQVTTHKTLEAMMFSTLTVITNHINSPQNINFKLSLKWEIIISLKLACNKKNQHYRTRDIQIFLKIIYTLNNKTVT